LTVTKFERENKHPKAFYLSEGTLNIVKNISQTDGASQSEVVTIAINYYMHYRNTLVTLAGMQREPMFIMGDTLKREFGVYQSTVDKCNAYFTRTSLDHYRDRRPIVHLMETCEYHLDHDQCSPSEREVFQKFIGFAKEFMDEAEKKAK